MREKVRERESESARGRERFFDDSHGWETVSRRRKPPSPTATRTAFITHLPTNFTYRDLEDLILPYGHALNMVIPNKTKPSWNFKFAFVLFARTSSLLTAIQNLYGKRIGAHKILIQPAKTDSRLRTNPNPVHQNLV